MGNLAPVPSGQAADGRGWEGSTLESGIWSRPPLCATPSQLQGQGSLTRMTACTLLGLQCIRRIAPPMPKRLGPNLQWDMEGTGGVSPSPRTTDPLTPILELLWSPRTRMNSTGCAGVRGLREEGAEYGLGDRSCDHGSCCGVATVNTALSQGPALDHRLLPWFS